MKVGEIAQVRTQDVGDDGARLDLVGVDQDGADTGARARAIAQSVQPPGVPTTPRRHITGFLEEVRRLGVAVSRVGVNVNEVARHVSLAPDQVAGVLAGSEVLAARGDASPTPPSPKITGVSRTTLYSFMTTRGSRPGGPRIPAGPARRRFYLASSDAGLASAPPARSDSLSISLSTSTTGSPAFT